MLVLELVLSIVGGVTVMVVFGWMAWVSRLLIDVRSSTIGITHRVKTNEDDIAQMKECLNEIAPRKVATVG